MVRRLSENIEFSLYVNNFFKLIHYLIYINILPRIPPSIRNMLQLSPNMRMNGFFLSFIQ